MCRVFDQERRVVSIEIVLLLSTLINHTLWEHTTKLHDEFKLLLLVISRE